jgi:hypothetical protein
MRSFESVKGTRGEREKEAGGLKKKAYLKILIKLVRQERDHFKKIKGEKNE